MVGAIARRDDQPAARPGRDRRPAAQPQLVERARTCTCSSTTTTWSPAAAATRWRRCVELLPQARDIGLHLIITRRVGGASRALYEPVLQRLRELDTPGFLMSGNPEEGALFGNSSRARSRPAAAPWSGAGRAAIGPDRLDRAMTIRGCAMMLPSVTVSPDVSHESSEG